MIIYFSFFFFNKINSKCFFSALFTNKKNTTPNNVTDKTIIMESGCLTQIDKSHKLINDPKVKEAYLGI